MIKMISSRTKFLRVSRMLWTLTFMKVIFGRRITTLGERRKAGTKSQDIRRNHEKERALDFDLHLKKEMALKVLLKDKTIKGIHQWI